MAEYTDEQWDTILENARNSGLWSIEDTNVLRGILSSVHTFGLHFLKEIQDIRTALVESLVAASCTETADLHQLIHFKGQVTGIDKMLALVRELAEKETE
jgi:hypothetical protein